MPDPVPREIKRQRSEQLHQLGEQMKREMLERQLGKQVPVLVEGDGSRGWFGYTPNYLRVEIEAPADAALQNRIIEVKLEAVAAEGERLLGKTTRPL